MNGIRRSLLSSNNKAPANCFYWYGDECTDRTGGWEAYNPYYSIGYQKGVSEKEADRLRMYWNGRDSYSAFFGTINKISTRGFNYIFMEMNLTGDYQFHFQIDNTHSGWGKVNAEIIAPNIARLDVRLKQGDYYLNIGIHQSAPSTSNNLLESFMIYGE